MANALYANYKNLLGGNGTHGFVDLDTDTIKLLLVDTADYTVNLATHQDHADVTGAGIVATSGALASCTFGVVAAGAFDHADTTLSSVSGDQSEAVIWYKDSGTSSTSPLICYFDTFASGMPVTPNGGNIIIAPHASGVFGF